MPDVDLDALGAQYREARASIGTHRARQAKAELALAATRRHTEDHADVDAARAAVERAVTDVQWCQAVTVAAAERYKGVPFDQVPSNRAAAASLSEGLQLLEQQASDEPAGPGAPWPPSEKS